MKKGNSEQACLRRKGRLPRGAMGALFLPLRLVYKPSSSLVIQPIHRGLSQPDADSHLSPSLASGRALKKVIGYMQRE